MLIHIYWTNFHSFDLHSNAPNWRKGRLKPARLFRKDKFIFEVKATEIIDIKSCVIVKIYHDKELSPTESVGSKSGNQRPRSAISWFGSTWSTRYSEVRLGCRHVVSTYRHSRNHTETPVSLSKTNSCPISALCLYDPVVSKSSVCSVRQVQ